MTLHHFCKEFRYLRLRWFAFLALLGFDLAVNLEWVFAPQWGEEMPSWIFFVPMVTALAALSLVEGCPEDRPGNDLRFIGTRPLSRRSYWLAALLTGLVLIVVPAAVQNGLYLWLSARPMADVLRGMGERAFFIIGLGLWMLPVRALTLEREKWLTGGVGLLIAIGGVFGLPILLRLIDEDAPGFDLPPSSWIFATLTLALAFTLLAWVHHRRPLKPQVRLGTMALLFVGGLMLCLYWPMRTAPMEDRDPARVAALAPAFNPSVHLEEVSFHDWGRSAESSGSLYLRSRIYPAAPGIHVGLTPKGARVQQGVTVTDDWWVPWSNPSRVSGNLHRVDANLAAFFPERTLFVQQSEKQDRWSGVLNSTSNAFAGLSSSFDLEQAVKVQARFRADWWEREKLLDSACVAGTTASVPDVTWTLVEALPHQIMGEKNELVSKRGAFSLRLRLNTRRHWDHGLATAFILHSPQRRLAWVGALETLHDVRGGGTGLERQTITLSWQDILNYADGEDAKVDPAQLRLVLISGRHLGESTWTWDAPPLVPLDHFSESNYRNSLGMIRGSGDRNSFRERIASLKPLTAESSEVEVQRYLYDVLMAIQSNWPGKNKAEEQDEEAALKPLFEHHLGMLLDVPRHLWNWGRDSVGERMLIKYLTEENRDAVIQRLGKSPHLIRVVLQRGWAEAARDYWHDRLMRSTHLDQDFIPLLLAWGDEASMDRIVTAMSYRLDSYYFIGEDGKRPAQLIARLRPLADEQFRATIPFANAMSESARPLATAADFGNVAAMEMCLRQLALDGEADRFNAPLPHLRDGQEKRIGMSFEDPESNTKLFRHRAVANFEYVPEQLAWRTLP
ncbi:hypothetical protein [Prosthecobacter sp.]|uniref:hypothetical protein n=1 Tax=Prosthecobacter sp. TaxID=1965333 RepID=UPI003784EE1A